MRVATILTELEPSLHSDINMGSYVPLGGEMTQNPRTATSALEFLRPGNPSGVNPSGVLGDPNGEPSATATEASALLCGLAPHTQFQVMVQVATPPEDPSGSNRGAKWERQGSEIVEFWTEQAPWQLLLSEYNLTDATAKLLSDAKLRSAAAWAELLDQGAEGADALGLEPAQRDLLATLCASEGAVTAREQAVLGREAKELNELVRTNGSFAVFFGSSCSRLFVPSRSHDLRTNTFAVCLQVVTLEAAAVGSLLYIYGLILNPDGFGSILRDG